MTPAWATSIRAVRSSESSGRRPAPAGPGRPAARRRGRWRWAPAAAVVVGVVGPLLAVGVTPWDLTRYAGYLLAGVLLPGVLLYRSLGRAPHSLVDDLAVGAVVGLAAELAGYVLFASVGGQRYLLAWPLALIGAFLAVPRLRRHWRRPTYPRRPPLAWSWCVAAVVLVYTTDTFISAVQTHPPRPVSGSGSWYLYDLLYLLGLTGEFKHHFPAHLPQAAAEPLRYHWFAFAHEASASLVSGVDTPVAFFQLGPPALAVLLVVLLAVVGWRISDGPWVGVVAAALMFAVGEVAITARAPRTFGSSTNEAWTSYSTLYGWVFTFALILVVVDRLRDDGLPAAPLRRAGWPFLIVVAVAAIGSKATAVPVTMAGWALAVTAVVVSRREIPLVRRIPGRFVGIGAVLIGAYAFGIVVLFRFETHGLFFAPFWGFRDVFDRQLRGAEWAAALAVAAVSYALYTGGRLAGIVVLATLARRGAAPWGPVGWFLLGGILVGVAGTMMMGHPSGSQLYFLRFGWPFGALLSAWGIVALVQQRRIRPATVVAITTATTVVALAVTSAIWYRLVWRQQPESAALPHPIRGLVMPWIDDLGVNRAISVLGVAGALIAIGLTAAALWRAARWFLARCTPPAGSPLSRFGGFVAVTAMLTAGAGAIPQHTMLTVNLPDQPVWHEPVSTDDVEAMHWLRAHSSPDEVFATNRHVPLSFWMNAFSERRAVVTSWTYAPRTVSEASARSAYLSQVPFWDPELLAANDALFYTPTPAALDRFHTMGVRWLVADRSVRPESPALARLTHQRYAHGRLAIYEIPDQHT